MKLLVLRRLVTQCLALLIFFSSSSQSFGAISSLSSWQPVVSPTNLMPPGLVAIDKKRQQLFFLQKNTPLKVSNSFLCSTGQVVGNKLVEGDLRTPEGIYFVVRHITSGLNFGLYGKEAYTLNYPNPVDRLNKKTGYGIWIHGRGSGISPLQTQGCVALNNRDLEALGKVLKPGTPVLLSSSFMQTPSAPTLNLKIKQLESLVKAWAKAWENRSARMFDYYDQDSYSISTESFSSFKSNKENVFKNLPWIKNDIEDIQILQGPNYWVTWFYQNYEAPNLTTRGIRRLYWKEDNKKGYKIIGMEWIPGQNSNSLFALVDDNFTNDMSEEPPRTEPQTEELLDNENSILTEENQVALDAKKQARIEAIAKIEADRLAKIEADRLAKIEAERLAKIEAERQAKIEAERQAKIEAERQAKIEAERQAKIEAERQAKIEAERQAKIEAERQAKIEAERQAKIEAERQAKIEADRLAKIEAERLAKIEAERQRSISNIFDSVKDNQIKLEELVFSWAKSWENRSKRMFDFYNPTLYSKNTESFTAFKSNKEDLFQSLDWIKIDVNNIQVSHEKDYWITAFNQTYSAPNLTVKGIRRLYWKDFGKKGFKIIRMTWIQGKSLAPTKNNISTISASKKALIEKSELIRNLDTDNKIDENLKKDSSISTATIQDVKKKNLETLVFEWAKAWSDRSTRMFSFYDKEAYSKNTESFKTFTSTKERLFKNLPWIKTKVYPIRIYRLSNEWVTEFYMEYEASNLKANGIRKLYWKENKNGQFHIIRMEFNPNEKSSSLGFQNRANDVLFNITSKNSEKKSDISKDNTEKQPENNELKAAFDLVEKWRKAWQRGDIEQYISYYGKNAMQGVRKGKNSIKAQKQSLWHQVTPVSVKFYDIKISPMKKGFYVEMTQEYLDSAKNKDTGVKKLYLELINGKLLITNEQWKVAQQ